MPFEETAISTAVLDVVSSVKRAAAAIAFDSQTAHALDQNLVESIPRATLPPSRLSYIPEISSRSPLPTPTRTTRASPSIVFAATRPAPNPFLLGLQHDVYTVLREAFTKGTADLQKAVGISLFDTCYDLSSRTSV
ncbi:Protein ASPARTIC PROTEASE IN GUARD CELL 2 [Platanthera guangdongensis]|uniref:Protein ASPARTIC PROTEASE IN GUARD CELL 2 n=1 Tax=Platanthera guangdongensis TaxID=2320717 RepID=A0ABR2N375_9ASPA